MIKKTNSISTIIFAALAIFLFLGSTYAQQSIIDTTKSNVKEYSRKQIVTPVELTFDEPKDYDNFAAGKLPINFILKNNASGQIVTLASRLLSEGFKPSDDKSKITVYLLINNLLAPVWDKDGCVETLTTAENVSGANGVNINIAYAACGSSQAQNKPGNPIGGLIVKGGSNPGTQNKPGGPIGNIIVKGGKNPGGNLMVMPGASEVTENTATAMKLKINPSNNGVKRTTAIIPVSSNKGSGSPKQAGF